MMGAVWLTGWLRRNPWALPRVMLLVGFLPFAIVPLHLYLALISWPEWPGYVKGMEFSLLDGVALAVYFSLPRGRGKLHFRVSMALYFAAVLLAVFQAQVTQAALFYPWQLARVFL